MRDALSWQQSGRGERDGGRVVEVGGRWETEPGPGWEPTSKGGDKGRQESQAALALASAAAAWPCARFTTGHFRRARVGTCAPLSCLEPGASNPNSAGNIEDAAGKKEKANALRGHQHSAMNLSLVDPFVLAQDCPEVITGKLREFDSALSPSLRRQGSLWT